MVIHGTASSFTPARLRSALATSSPPSPAAAASCRSRARPRPRLLSALLRLLPVAAWTPHHRAAPHAPVAGLLRGCTAARRQLRALPHSPLPWRRLPRCSGCFSAGSACRTSRVSGGLPAPVRRLLLSTRGHGGTSEAPESPPARLRMPRPAAPGSLRSGRRFRPRGGLPPGPAALGPRTRRLRPRLRPASEPADSPLVSPRTATHRLVLAAPQRLAALASCGRTVRTPPPAHPSRSARASPPSRTGFTSRAPRADSTPPDAPPWVLCAGSGSPLPGRVRTRASVRSAHSAGSCARRLPTIRLAGSRASAPPVTRTAGPRPSPGSASPAAGCCTPSPAACCG
nr:uncharacterized protein DKFZp434B061-like [Aegilops tauschii subsp. strangulata]